MKIVPFFAYGLTRGHRMVVDGSVGQGSRVIDFAINLLWSVSLPGFLKDFPGVFVIRLSLQI